LSFDVFVDHGRLSQILFGHSPICGNPFVKDSPEVGDRWFVPQMNVFYLIYRHIKQDFGRSDAVPQNREDRFGEFEFVLVAKCVPLNLVSDQFEFVRTYRLRPTETVTHRGVYEDVVLARGDPSHDFA